MSFDALETSRHAGQPVELFRFRMGRPPVAPAVETCHEVAKQAPAIFAEELANAIRTVR